MDFPAPSCDVCKKKMYGYMNDELIFWLCPPCGYYEGSSDDKELVEFINSGLLISPKVKIKFI